MKDHLKSFILEQKSKRSNFITDKKRQPFLMERLLLNWLKFCEIGEISLILMLTDLSNHST